VSTLNDALMRFCGEAPSSVYHKPFVMNGWKYWTDNRVAVRLRTNDPDTPAVEGRHNPEPAFKDFELKQLADLPKVKHDDLTVDCECDSDADCGRCRGTGRVVEKACEVFGDGYWLIDTRFARLIRGLPGVKVEAKPPQGDLRDFVPMRFIFDGNGQGMVCPVKKHDEK
jgi:hypothetical protein